MWYNAENFAIGGEKQKKNKAEYIPVPSGRVVPFIGFIFAILNVPNLSLCNNLVRMTSHLSSFSSENVSAKLQIQTVNSHCSIISHSVQL